MNKDLLILSAALISEELQQYFGQLPSAMVPFHNRPALDYLYHEHLNHYNNIYMVVKEEHVFIQEFLIHSQYNIQLIVLPELGNLLDSVRYGLEQIKLEQQTVTILFGDTYIPYMTRYFLDKDVLMYAHSQDSERWTVIEQEENGHLHFIDKRNLSKQEYYPIVVGAFHLIHPNRLLQLLQTLPKTNGSSFYDVMEYYYNERSTELVYVDNWVDFGHEDKYFEQKRRVSARSFNEVYIQPEQAMVVKRSLHVEKFIDEIQWFLQLPSALQSVVPTIYYYSIDPQAPYVKMSFHDMLTLHEIFIHGNHRPQRWKEILLELQAVNTSFKQYQPKTTIDTRSLRYEMYVNKTLVRLKKFIESDLIDATKPLIINGKTYPALIAYMEMIEPIAVREGVLNDAPFNIIHGDFCFTNILYDQQKDQVILIDPRGSFGQSGIYGDNRYEWAKLAHSIEGGYDLIIADRYSVECIENNIIYKMHKHSIHDQIKECFYQTILDVKEQRAVRFIQALLFLAMLPLHADTPKRQYVMLCRAIELFDDFRPS